MTEAELITKLADLEAQGKAAQGKHREALRLTYRGYQHILKAKQGLIPPLYGTPKDYPKPEYRHP